MFVVDAVGGRSRTAVTRGRRPEYRARGPLRAVPRLDVTAGRQGARGHLLVFRGSPEADRPSWRHAGYQEAFASSPVRAAARAEQPRIKRNSLPVQVIGLAAPV